MRAEDQRRSREIRAGDNLEQLFGGDRRVFDEGEAAIDHFAQVMRRNVGRHADGNAARAIDQQVGKTRRKHRRLLPRAIIIVGEIDGILVEIVKQAVGHFGQSRFGIAHRGRIIGIHRAEIALAIDQRHPHRPILRHADQREVDRGVTVWMIIAHHVADDLGAFAIGPPGDHAAFLRREQDPAVHWLEAIAHIGQRAGNDHAHRVIKVTRLHFIDNVDALILAERRGGIGNFGVVAHAENSYPVGGKGEPKALGQDLGERQQKGGKCRVSGLLFHICYNYAE